ncbi:ubiquitin-conjugating enzyme/RWD-like protein [Obelidium mucronatum]|nr:ubiquitin-conjugating enzyme/RWD-like protein [Obelidium mucronatum]
MATARIKKEIAQCMAPDSPVKGHSRDPTETPYEGGVFEVDIEITMEYPFKPPKMKCNVFQITLLSRILIQQNYYLCLSVLGHIVITKVYHPNVSSQTGAICLDILKDQWSPVLTLKTALISLQSLMSDAAADNPQDAQVANHYINDRAGFNNTARQWTKLYAGGGASEDPDYIDPSVDRTILQRLVDMGFDKKVAGQTLKKFSNDENRAIEALLG